LSLLKRGVVSISDALLIVFQFVHPWSRGICPHCNKVSAVGDEAFRCIMACSALITRSWRSWRIMGNMGCTWTMSWTNALKEDPANRVATGEDYRPYM